MTEVRLAVQSLLLDMDGTLVDSTAVVDRLWSDLGRSLGFGPDEVVGRFHGMPLAGALRQLVPDLEPARSAALRAEFVAAEMESLSGLVPVPGAAALLRALPSHRWAVVTSATRTLAEARLSQVGLPVPQVMITADDVVRGKPDPEPYLAGARALGFAPAECLALEDAPAGVTSGRAAGCHVLGVRTTDPDLPGPAVPDLRGLVVTDTGTHLDVTWDESP